jgi:nicotinamidase-related amidase
MTVYEASSSTILLVDPYNDFLAEGGKLWPRVKAVAEEVRLLDHLQEVVSTARAHGLRIFFVLHNRWKPGAYVSFDFPSPHQLESARAEAFAEASAGAGRFMRISSLSRGMSSPVSTGDLAASPTPTSICS